MGVEVWQDAKRDSSVWSSAKEIQRVGARFSFTKCLKKQKKAFCTVVVNTW